MRTPRILCISFSEFRKDSRVLRQLSVLRQFGAVTTLGYGDAPEAATEHLEIPRHLASLPQTPSGVVKLAFRQFKSVELTAPAEKEALKLLEGRDFDLVVANDARALPLAFFIAPGERILADLHEWAPAENSNNLLWRLLVGPYMRYLCHRYLRQCRATTTVNGSIAELYFKEFGVTPGIVRNSSSYRELNPSTVDPKNIRLVHSGIAVPERNIEAIIEAVLASASYFSLDLYLIAQPNSTYLKFLQRKADNSPRIRFIDPLMPQELVTALNHYDLGIFLLPPRTLNNKLMLPNKFFDYVQARLGLIFSPAKEVDKLINQWQLGPRLERHSSAELTTILNSLTIEQINTWKANAHEAAPKLSFQTDERQLRSAIDSVLKAESN